MTGISKIQKQRAGCVIEQTNAGLLSDVGHPAVSHFIKPVR